MLHFVVGIQLENDHKIPGRKLWSIWARECSKCESWMPDILHLKRSAVVAWLDENPHNLVVQEMLEHCMADCFARGEESRKRFPVGIVELGQCQVEFFGTVLEPVYFFRIKLLVFGDVDQDHPMEFFCECGVDVLAFGLSLDAIRCVSG